MTDILIALSILTITVLNAVLFTNLIDAFERLEQFKPFEQFERFKQFKRLERRLGK